MKPLACLLLGLLLAITLSALSASYNYFPPPGTSYTPGAFTLGAAATASAPAATGSLTFQNPSAGINQKLWNVTVDSSGTLTIASQTDAGGAGKTALTIKRGTAGATGTLIGNIDFLTSFGPGNPTSDFNISGSGDFLYTTTAGSPNFAVISSSTSTSSAINFGVANNSTGSDTLYETSSTFVGSLFTNLPAGEMSDLDAESSAGTTWSCFTTNFVGAGCIDTNQNWLLNLAATAVGDTNGYVYIPQVAGVPTGVPAGLTGAYANAAPVRWDSTDSRLYIYTSGWKDVADRVSLRAVSASIGGGALGAGACASTTTTITGAAVGMNVEATPNTYPGDSAFWKAYVSAANTITTLICEAVAGTPTASTYNLKVLQ